jgi:signal transduction histidine kinase
MLMPASAEFAALCQSQLAMMTQLVGAHSTAVYLAKSWSDQQTSPNLLPIALYPPTRQDAAGSTPEKALPASSGISVARPSQPEFPDFPETFRPEPRLSPATEPATDSANSLQRLAIPMIHEGGVFGVLVGWRADRPWLDTERDLLEECARSLTLACVMDQRGQWLQSQMSSLDQLQDQQSDRFHELLHQLRSPLTALKTFGKLLTKRLTIDDPNRRLVSNMLRESDRMQELLGFFDDTLQAAEDSREATATTVPLLPGNSSTATPPLALKAASGSLAHFGGTLALQTIEIGSLLQPLIELMQPLAEDAQMTLQAIASPLDLWIKADPKALTEILSILIDNALKYGTAGSQIWLAWGWPQSQFADLAEIVVGDTGPGIPTEDQGHIFERHYRGRQASGDLEGSGLGLSIAADLVEEMQGKLAVFSPLSALPYPLPRIIDPACKHHGTAFIVGLPAVDAITID